LRMIAPTSALPTTIGASSRASGGSDRTREAGTMAMQSSGQMS
jgi:hypothetical protein